MQVDPEFKKQSPLQIIIILAILILIGIVAAFFYSSKKERIALEDNLNNIEVGASEERVLFLLNDGQLDEAINEANKVITNSPNDISGYLSLANAYLQKGSIEFDEENASKNALEVINQVLYINPYSSDGYRLMGYAYEIVEEYEKAEASYNSALIIAPNDSYTLGARGHMYELMGDFEKAESDYISALKNDSENEKALMDLATLYIQTNQTEDYDVEDMLNMALDMSKDSITRANIHDSVGFFYFNEGEYQKSADSYYEAIKQDKRLTSAWIGIAFSQLMLAGAEEDDLEYTRRIDLAIDAIDSAFDLNENLANAYVAQAIMAGYFGDTAVEIEMYNEALNVVDKDITLGAYEKDLLKKSIKETLALIEEGEFEEPAI